jgi:hypothetical protein
MGLDLDGRTVITATGIGRATALAFALAGVASPPVTSTLGSPKFPATKERTRTPKMSKRD